MLYRRVQVNLPASGTGYSDAARLRQLEPCGKITRVLIRHAGAELASVVTLTLAKHESDNPDDWAVSDKVWEYSGLSITGAGNTTDLDHNTLAVVRGAPYPDDGNALWLAVNVTTAGGGGASTLLLVCVEAEVGMG